MSTTKTFTGRDAAKVERLYQNLAATQGKADGLAFERGKAIAALGISGGYGISDQAIADRWSELTGHKYSAPTVRSARNAWVLASTFGSVTAETLAAVQRAYSHQVGAERIRELLTLAKESGADATGAASALDQERERRAAQVKQSKAGPTVDTGTSASGTPTPSAEEEGKPSDGQVSDSEGAPDAAADSTAAGIVPPVSEGGPAEAHDDSDAPTAPEDEDTARANLSALLQSVTATALRRGYSLTVIEEAYRAEWTRVEGLIAAEQDAQAA